MGGHAQCLHLGELAQRGNGAREGVAREVENLHERGEAADLRRDGTNEGVFTQIHTASLRQREVRGQNTREAVPHQADALHAAT